MQRGRGAKLGGRMDRIRPIGGRGLASLDSPFPEDPWRRQQPERAIMLAGQIRASPAYRLVHRFHPGVLAFASERDWSVNELVVGLRRFRRQNDFRVQQHLEFVAATFLLDTGAQ